MIKLLLFRGLEIQPTLGIGVTNCRSIVLYKLNFAVFLYKLNFNVYFVLSLVLNCMMQFPLSLLMDFCFIGCSLRLSSASKLQSGFEFKPKKFHCLHDIAGALHTTHISGVFMWLHVIDSFIQLSKTMPHFQYRLPAMFIFQNIFSILFIPNH